MRFCRPTCLSTYAPVSYTHLRSYPITPTYAGKLYIDFAQQVLLSESQINRKIGSVVSNPRMRIRIGISPSKSVLIMPELINSILKEFPDCIISLEDSKDENSLFAMLENNEIDVMIGSPHQNTIKYKSCLLYTSRCV